MEHSEQEKAQVGNQPVGASGCSCHLPFRLHFSLNDSYPDSLDLQTIFLG